MIAIAQESGRLESIGALVARGLQFHQNGDLASAEQVYRSILTCEPDNADALHLMGSVRGRQGLTIEGIRLMEQAISVSPRVSHYHNNLGNLKIKTGDVLGAEESYRQAIRVDRMNADAHLNLGKLLEVRGLKAKARESYMASLRRKPRSVEAHMSLGRLEESEGNARAALQSYGNAVRLEPGYAAGHLAVGNAQAKLKRLEEAENSYRAAVALEPEFTDALFNLANALRAQGKPDEAVQVYQRAIALPGRADGDMYNNYGLALSDLNRHEEAEAAFRMAIEVRSDFDDAYFNLGKELTTFGDRAAGMEMLRRAIEINPRNLSAHIQLGTALHASGALLEAIEANRRAMELDSACLITRRNLGMVLAHAGDAGGLEIIETMVRDLPESVDLHWTFAEKLLLHGRYEEGWREYEWRMQVEELRWEHPKFEEPRWTGEPLEGKRILLYAEQGFGDTLQFARYAQLVADRGGAVVIQVQAALRRWCAALPGITECIAYGEPLPQFDVFAPLMSLPHLLGTGATFPPPVAALIEALQPNETSGKVRVGIVWSGSGKHILDRLRSTRLMEWKGLAEIEGVEFTSLQVGDPAMQIEEGGHGFEFAGDCGAVRDFCDTAAIIAGLDLVITVDTAVAHLAATMGKRVWILLYTVVDWRWGLGGTTTPWYPGVRLFRQTTPGDWLGVFAEVELELRELVGSRLRLPADAW